MFAPRPMQSHRPSSSRAPRARARRVAPVLALGLGAAVAAPLLASSVAAAVSAPAPAVVARSAEAQGRPDQVYVWNERTSDVKVVSGTIVADGLDKVTVSRGGSETKLDAALVREVVWGASSMAFQEAVTYFDRGDWENAAAKYLVAAGEDEREVIQAAARLGAARAFMNWGATDAGHYAEAAQQFDTFLSDYSTNRQVPRARALQARNAWLGGDAAKAGGLFRGLFEEGASASPTPGYDLGLCLDAGLQAARAMLAADDTLAAREIYGVLANRARTAAASAEEGSADRAHFSRLETEALLGSGFVDVASGQYDQAITFFNGQLSTAKTSGNSTALYGATYGMALALHGKGEIRKAQLQFATVSALDYTDEDRSAAAKLGLARCYRELGDSDGMVAAKALLTEIIEQFGTTPSARAARELLSE